MPEIIVRFFNYFRKGQQNTPLASKCSLQSTSTLQIDTVGKKRGFIQFLPLILLVIFSSVIFVIVNQVQKQQQDIRSRAASNNLYPTAKITTTPTTVPKGPGLGNRCGPGYGDCAEGQCLLLGGANFTVCQNVTVPVATIPIKTTTTTTLTPTKTLTPANAPTVKPAIPIGGSCIPGDVCAQGGVCGMLGGFNNYVCQTNIVAVPTAPVTSITTTITQKTTTTETPPITPKPTPTPARGQECYNGLGGHGGLFNDCNGKCGGQQNVIEDPVTHKTYCKAPTPTPTTTTTPATTTTLTPGRTCNQEGGHCDDTCGANEDKVSAWYNGVNTCVGESTSCCLPKKPTGTPTPLPTRAPGEVCQTWTGNDCARCQCGYSSFAGFGTCNACTAPTVTPTKTITPATTTTLTPGRTCNQEGGHCDDTCGANEDKVSAWYNGVNTCVGESTSCCLPKKTPTAPTLAPTLIPTLPPHGEYCYDGLGGHGGLGEECTAKCGGQANVVRDTTGTYCKAGATPKPSPNCDGFKCSSALTNVDSDKYTCHNPANGESCWPSQICCPKETPVVTTTPAQVFGQGCYNGIGGKGGAGENCTARCGCQQNVIRDSSQRTYCSSSPVVCPTPTKTMPTQVIPLPGQKCSGLGVKNVCDKCPNGFHSDAQGASCNPASTVTTTITPAGATVADALCGGCTPEKQKCVKSEYGYQCVDISAVTTITPETTITVTPTSSLVPTVPKAPRVPLPSGPYTCSNAPGLPPGKGGEIINGGACIVYECDGSTGRWVNRSKDGYNYNDLTNPGGIGPNDKTATCINNQALIPTPDPQHPAKKSCSNNYGNVVGELPDGVVSIGPIQNGNNRWKCVDGQWIQCSGCMLTVVPDYLQNDPTFLAEQKKYNDAVLTAEQLYSTTYQACHDSGKSDADCKAAAQTALDADKEYTQQMMDAAVSGYSFNTTLQAQYYPLLEKYNLCLLQNNNDEASCADLNHQLNKLAGSQGLTVDQLNNEKDGINTTGYQSYLQSKLVTAYLKAQSDYAQCLAQKQSTCVDVSSQVLNYPGLKPDMKKTIVAIGDLREEYLKSDSDLCANIPDCNPDRRRAELMAAATDVPDEYKDMIANAYHQQVIENDVYTPAINSYVACIMNGEGLGCSSYQQQALSACKQLNISDTDCQKTLDQQVYITRDFSPAMTDYFACADEGCKADKQKQILSSCAAQMTAAQCTSMFTQRINDYSNLVNTWKNDPNALLTQADAAGLQNTCSVAKSHNCSDQEVSDFYKEEYGKLTDAQRLAYDTNRFGTSTGFADYKNSHPDATVEDFLKSQDAAMKRFQSTLATIYPPGSKEYNDYLAKVQSGEINVEGAEKAYNTTKGNALGLNWWVLTFNELSGGATKRGNDIQMAAVAAFQQENKGTIFDTDWVANDYLVARTVGTFLNPLTLIPTALGIGPKLSVSDQLNFARGAVEQGALPAAAGVAIAAFPAALVITAPMSIATVMIVGGSALGVAGTTSSLSQVAQYCDGTKVNEKACIVSAVNTGIMAVGTVIGVGAGESQLANVAARVAVSKAEQAAGTSAITELTQEAVQTGKNAALASTQTAGFFQGVQRTFSLVSTGWFGYQASQSCFGKQVNDAACATNVLMTLASFSQFGTSFLKQAQPLATVASKGAAGVNVAANGAQVLTACILSQGRDVAGCAQAVGGFAMSVHGFGGGAEAGGGESATVELDKATSELDSYYEGGKLKDNINIDKFNAAKTAYEQAVNVRAVELAEISKAMETVSGKNLLTGEKMLVESQTAYGAALKTYEDFVNENSAKPALIESPAVTQERTRLQTALDGATTDLLQTKAYALHEEQLANTTPKNIIAQAGDVLGRLTESPEAKAFRLAQDEFRTVALTASPDSSEYQLAARTAEDAQRTVLIQTATPDDITIEKNRARSAIVALDSEKDTLEKELTSMTPAEAKAARDATLRDLLNIKNNSNASEADILETQRSYNNAQAVYEYVTYSAAESAVSARYDSLLTTKVSNAVGDIRDRIFGTKTTTTTTETTSQPEIPKSQSERRLSVTGDDQKALAKALRTGQIVIRDGTLAEVGVIPPELHNLVEKVSANTDTMSDTVRSIQYEAARSDYIDKKITVTEDANKRVIFHADDTVSPDVKNLVNSMNEDLRTVEKVIGEKEGIPNYAIRGSEAGEKDQMRIISDALFSGNKDSLGKLYESITGSGKSTLMIPLIAEMKSKYSGRDVLVILPSEENITQMYAKFPPDVFKQLGVDVVRYDQSTNVHGAEFNDAHIIVTTKDVIFDSIRTGVDADTIMSRVRGAALVADEAQLTLQLDTDYNVSAGPQKPVTSMQNGQHLIDTFKEVQDETAALRERALSERGLIIMKDGKGVITDPAAQTEVYRTLAKEGLPAIDEMVRTKNISFEQALDAYLTTDTSDKTVAQTQQTIRERIAAFNSITKVLADVPGTGFGLDEAGNVVPYDGGVNNGRRYSNVMDALAYEAVGKERLGIADQIDFSKVTVSEKGVTTNYAEFLKNFSEIYGFSGTPDLLKQQFDRIYGINVSTSPVDQSTFVFGAYDSATGIYSIKPTHPIATVSTAGALDDLTITAPQNGTGHNIVVTDPSISSDDVVAKAREQNPSVDVVVIDPNGKHAIIGADGTIKNFDTLEALDAYVKTNYYGVGTDNPPKEFIRIFKYGSHYGTDTYQQPTDRWTIIAGTDTDRTTFLQGIGRDRGTNGGYAPDTNVIVLGDTSITNQQDLLAKLDINEVNTVKQVELNGIQRIVDNKVIEIVRSLEAADAAAGKGKGTSYYEGLVDKWTARSELDYSVGTGESRGVDVLTDKFRRAQEFIRSLDSDLPTSGPVRDAYNAASGNGEVVDTLNLLQGKGSEVAPDGFVPFNETKSILDLKNSVEAVVGTDDIPATIARGVDRASTEYVAASKDIAANLTTSENISKAEDLAVRVTAGETITATDRKILTTGLSAINSTIGRYTASLNTLHTQLAAAQTSQNASEITRLQGAVQQTEIDLSDAKMWKTAIVAAKAKIGPDTLLERIQDAITNVINPNANVEQPVKATPLENVSAAAVPVTRDEVATELGKVIPADTTKLDSAKATDISEKQNAAIDAIVAYETADIAAKTDTSPAVQAVAVSAKGAAVTAIDALRTSLPQEQQNAITNTSENILGDITASVLTAAPVTAPNAQMVTAGQVAPAAATPTIRDRVVTWIKNIFTIQPDPETTTWDKWKQSGNWFARFMDWTTDQHVQFNQPILRIIETVVRPLINVTPFGLGKNRTGFNAWFWNSIDTAVWYVTRVSPSPLWVYDGLRAIRFGFMHPQAIIPLGVRLGLVYGFTYEILGLFLGGGSWTLATYASFLLFFNLIPSTVLPAAARAGTAAVQQVVTAPQGTTQPATTVSIADRYFVFLPENAPEPKAGLKIAYTYRGQTFAGTLNQKINNDLWSVSGANRLAFYVSSDHIKPFGSALPFPSLNLADIPAQELTVGTKVTYVFDKKNNTVAEGTITSVKDGLSTIEYPYPGTGNLYQDPNTKTRSDLTITSYAVRKNMENLFNVMVLVSTPALTEAATTQLQSGKSEIDVRANIAWMILTVTGKIPGIYPAEQLSLLPKTVDMIVSEVQAHLTLNTEGPWMKTILKTDAQTLVNVAVTQLAQGTKPDDAAKSVQAAIVKTPAAQLLKSNNPATFDEITLTVARQIVEQVVTLNTFVADASPFISTVQDQVTTGRLVGNAQIQAKFAEMFTAMIVGNNITNIDPAVLSTWITTKAAELAKQIKLPPAAAVPQVPPVNPNPPAQPGVPAAPVTSVAPAAPAAGQPAAETPEQIAARINALDRTVLAGELLAVAEDGGIAPGTALVTASYILVAGKAGYTITGPSDPNYVSIPMPIKNAIRDTAIAVEFQTGPLYQAYLDGTESAPQTTLLPSGTALTKLMEWNGDVDQPSYLVGGLLAQDITPFVQQLTQGISIAKQQEIFSSIETILQKYERNNNKYDSGAISYVRDAIHENGLVDPATGRKVISKTDLADLLLPRENVPTWVRAVISAFIKAQPAVAVADDLSFMPENITELKGNLNGFISGVNKALGPYVKQPALFKDTVASAQFVVWKFSFNPSAWGTIFAEIQTAKMHLRDAQQAVSEKRPDDANNLIAQADTEIPADSPLRPAIATQYESVQKALNALKKQSSVQLGAPTNNAVNTWDEIKKHSNLTTTTEDLPAFKNMDIGNRPDQVVVADGLIGKDPIGHTRTVTETDVMQNLRDFISQLKQRIQEHGPYTVKLKDSTFTTTEKDIADFENNILYLGDAELTQGAKKIATHWIDYVMNGKTVYVLNSNFRGGSNQYFLLQILQQLDGLLAQVRSVDPALAEQIQQRIVVYDFNTTDEIAVRSTVIEDIKKEMTSTQPMIISVDDWRVSGTQIGSSVMTMKTILAEALGREITDQESSAYQEIDFLVDEQNRPLKGVSVYTPFYKTTVGSFGESLSGTWSVVDYGFSQATHVDQILKEDKIEQPFAFRIVRPYLTLSSFGQSVQYRNPQIRRQWQQIITTWGRFKASEPVNIVNPIVVAYDAAQSGKTSGVLLQNEREVEAYIIGLTADSSILQQLVNDTARMIMSGSFSVTPIENDGTITDEFSNYLKGQIKIVLKPFVSDQSILTGLYLQIDTDKINTIAKDILMRDDVRLWKQSVIQSEVEKAVQALEGQKFKSGTNEEDFAYRNESIITDYLNEHFPASEAYKRGITYFEYRDLILDGVANAIFTNTQKTTAPAAQPASVTALKSLQDAMKEEEQLSKQKVEKALGVSESDLYVITDSDRAFINQALEQRLTPAQQDKIARYVIRVLSALNTKSSSVYDAVQAVKGIPLFLHPSEADAISASLQYILNDTIRNSRNLQISNHAHIQKLITAVVRKETNREDMPVEMRQDLEKLYQQMDPTYTYNPDDPADYINDLVLTTQEIQYDLALGGGTIQINRPGATPLMMAQAAFHERMHNFMMQFLLPAGITSRDLYEEIIATALEYLYSSKASLDTSFELSSLYWSPTRDFVHILQTLKAANVFDWDSADGREKLFRMATSADLSEIIQLYARAKGVNPVPIIDHFKKVNDGYLNEVEEQAGRSYLSGEFSSESKQLGLDSVENISSSAQPAAASAETYLEERIHGIIDNANFDQPYAMDIQRALSEYSSDLPVDKQQTALENVLAVMAGLPKKYGNPGGFTQSQMPKLRALVLTKLFKNAFAELGKARSFTDLVKNRQSAAEILTALTGLIRDEVNTLDAKPALEKLQDTLVGSAMPLYRFAQEAEELQIFIQDIQKKINELPSETAGMPTQPVQQAGQSQPVAVAVAQAPTQQAGVAPLYHVTSTLHEQMITELGALGDAEQYAYILARFGTKAADAYKNKYSQTTGENRVLLALREAEKTRFGLYIGQSKTVSVNGVQKSTNLSSISDTRAQYLVQGESVAIVDYTDFPQDKILNNDQRVVLKNSFQKSNPSDTRPLNDILDDTPTGTINAVLVAAGLPAVALDPEIVTLQKAYDEKKAAPAVPVVAPVVEQPAAPVVEQQAPAQTVSLSSPLPTLYEDSLQVIPADAPQSFKDSARRAAYFFWALEEGKIVVDENGNSLEADMKQMVNQLRSTGFVGNSYMYNREQTALPKWIVTAPDLSKANDALTDQQKQQIQSIYQRFIQTYAIDGKEEKGTWGVYAYYDKGIAGKANPSDGSVTTKAYIEGSDLLKESEINALFDELRRAGLHPDTSKLSESERMVVYWTGNLTQAQRQQITEIASHHAVYLRGPAQDPNQWALDSKGGFSNYSNSFGLSNDNALGDAGRNPNRWLQTTYDAKAFFETYLRLTLFGGKRPDDPYIEAFSTLLTGNVSSLTDAQLQFIRQFAQTSPLPIYVTGDNRQVVQQVRDEIEFVTVQRNLPPAPAPAPQEVAQVLSEEIQTESPVTPADRAVDIAGGTIPPVDLGLKAARSIRIAQAVEDDLAPPDNEQVIAAKQKGLSPKATTARDTLKQKALTNTEYLSKKTTPERIAWLKSQLGKMGLNPGDLKAARGVAKSADDDIQKQIAQEAAQKQTQQPALQPTVAVVPETAQPAGNAANMIDVVDPNTGEVHRVAATANPPVAQPQTQPTVAPQPIQQTGEGVRQQLLNAQAQADDGLRAVQLQIANAYDDVRIVNNQPIPEFKQLLSEFQSITDFSKRSHGQRLLLIQTLQQLILKAKQRADVIANVDGGRDDTFDNANSALDTAFSRLYSDEIYLTQTEYAASVAPQTPLETAAKKLTDPAADALDRAIDDCGGQSLRLLPQVYAQTNGGGGTCTFFEKTLKDIGMTKFTKTIRNEGWKTPNREILERLQAFILSKKPPVIATNTLVLLSEYIADLDMVAWNSTTKSFYMIRDDQNIPLFISGNSYRLNSQGKWVSSAGYDVPDTTIVQTELTGLLLNLAKKSDSKEAFFFDLNTLFGVSFAPDPLSAYTFQPPEQWILDTLRSDPHIVSVGFTDPSTDLRRALLTPDLSKLSTQDQETFGIYIGMLQSFLSAPKIVDTFTSHTDRRAWLRSVQDQITASRGQSDAGTIFAWISNGKLTRGEIGVVTMVVDSIAHQYPTIFDASFTQTVADLRTTLAAYDTTPLDEKERIEEKAEEISWQTLEYIALYAKPVEQKITARPVASYADLPLNGSALIFNKGHVYGLDTNVSGLIREADRFMLPENTDGTRAIIPLEQIQAYFDLPANQDKWGFATDYIYQELIQYSLDGGYSDYWFNQYQQKPDAAVLQRAITELEVDLKNIPLARSQLAAIKTLDILNKPMPPDVAKKFPERIQYIEDNITLQNEARLRAKLNDLQKIQTNIQSMDYGRYYFHPSLFLTDSGSRG